MGSRKYIVGVVTVALIFFGPLDPFPIRIAYLILVPLATWFALGWFWKVWNPDQVTEQRLQRSFAGATAGVLLVLAIIEGVSDTHIGNTQWIRTCDGMEAVGNDIVLSGPDWVTAIMLLAASGFAFWLSVSKKGLNQQK